MATATRKRKALSEAAFGVAQAPFDEAIRAFAGRSDILPKEEFLKLEEANRARAWTVARVSDLNVLNDLHQASEKISGAGGTFRGFIDALGDIMEQRGWAGLTPWHAQLVYDQNVAMGYTAGRYDQAQRAGVEYWRYLPSQAAVPREEHKPYYHRVYPMGEGPMPPLDFGCACEWEVVFNDELDGEDVQTHAPRVPDGQEFRFHPSSYFGPLTVRSGDYPPELLAALQRAAQNDPRIKIELN